MGGAPMAKHHEACSNAVHATVSGKFYIAHGARLVMETAHVIAVCILDQVQLGMYLLAIMLRT